MAASMYMGMWNLARGAYKGLLVCLLRTMGLIRPYWSAPVKPVRS